MRTHTRTHARTHTQAFVGTGFDSFSRVLLQREGHESLTTRGDHAVAPVALTKQFNGAVPLEVDITWLLDAEATTITFTSGSSSGGSSSTIPTTTVTDVHFAIDRRDPAVCHTPRRNAQVEAVVRNAAQLCDFLRRADEQLRCVRAC